MTAEEQLKKLKEKEKALKAKIKREREKAELQELKKMQKYLKYIDVDALKNLVDYLLNKTVEVKNYDDNKVMHTFNRDDIKKLIQIRLKNKPSFFEVDKIKKM